MQRITVHQLSAIFLVVVLSQFAALTASAAGNRRVAGRTAKRSAHHRAKRSTPTGGVFGGVTSAGWPVVIQVSSDGREVVRATMGLPMRCQPSGGEFDVADFYTGIPISATGAFQGKEESSSSVGLSNGQVGTVTGQMTGKLNRTMTAMTGTWRNVLVVHDATGATVDTCDSGTVSFTASR
jgi:hypothetical protein